MSDAAAHSSSRLLGRPWFLAALLAALLLLALLLPSQLSISRYQRSVASVMARSIGRPVHLSGVDWRLLPTPAFILHDLTVSEDASFGAEPLLTARTVIASVSLYSLWRGHPVFSSIHVDQASLNLVRNNAGRWNLEALLAAPAQQHHLAATAPSSAQRALPYLEATESRLNLKFGLEKSPYSLVNSDLSFWQEQPGHWRIRLRGQPVRTDIAENTDAGQDSGEIRIEGSLQSAPTLRQIPVHLQLAWRNAQLGQLSLLLLGNDAGWRGNLTADLALNGTAEQASIQGRLRATEVHRADLGPIAPLDFDSNCGLLYQHTLHAIHQLHCDTRIGDGHLLYAAELPAAQPAQQSVTLQRIPLQATLDLLRTLRSNFAPGLSATGVLDGELRLQPPAATPSPHRAHAQTLPTNTPVWAGSIALTGGKISGNSLAQPWSLNHLTLQPNPSGALAATVPLPVCAEKPAADCSAALALTHSGYQIYLTGNASIPRLRSFSTALGLPLPLLDGFRDGIAEMQLQTAGSWLATSTPITRPTLPDQLTGSLHLRAVRWSHPSLAFPVLIPDATLSLGPASLTLRGSAISGPASSGSTSISPASRGPAASSSAIRSSTASDDKAALRAQFVFTQPLADSDPLDASTADSTPTLDLTLNRLDAAAIESALVPASAQSGLFAAIASRVHSASDLPPLPPLRLTVKAASCSLDRLTLSRCSANLHRAPADPPHAFTLDDFEAAFAGGSITATGLIDHPDDAQRLRIHLVASNLQPAPLAALVAAHWTGGVLTATSDLTAQGSTPTQWITTATLQFDWTHGNLGQLPADHNKQSGKQSGKQPPTAKEAATAQPIVFDRWTGSATWADHRLTLGTNSLTRRGKSTSLTGFIPYGGPPHLAVHLP